MTSSCKLVSDMAASLPSLKEQLGAVLDNTWSDEPPDECERIQMTVRLDREDLEFVSAIAETLECGRAEVIRRLVKEGLSDLGHLKEDLGQ